jgi:DNA integrity scanning protein DisA with diadenylate cyclase activity
MKNRGTFNEKHQVSLDNTDFSETVSGSLRKSSYTISVKLDAEKDKYMLLHGYTGALDVVSEKVVKWLDNVNNSDSRENRNIGIYFQCSEIERISDGKDRGRGNVACTQIGKLASSKRKNLAEKFSFSCCVRL